MKGGCSKGAHPDFGKRDKKVADCRCKRCGISVGNINLYVTIGRSCGSRGYVLGEGKPPGVWEYGITPKW